MEDKRCKSSFGNYEFPILDKNTVRHVPCHRSLTIFKYLNITLVKYTGKGGKMLKF